jgi:superfamily II DNA or RNA helicase
MININIIEHLNDLDHGTVQDLLGDYRVVELLIELERINTGKINRGDLILRLLGGIENLLLDKSKRRKLFLSLSRGSLEKIKEQIGGKDPLTLNLRNRENLKELCSVFGIIPERGESEDTNEENLKAEYVNVSYGLFEHQSCALLKCMEIFESNKPRAMLHMPTGSGKTRTAMHLIARHLNNQNKSLVLWLVQGKELCDQASLEFKNAWKSLGERNLPLLNLWSDTKGIDECLLKLTDVRPDEIWPKELEDGVIISSIDTLRNMISKWEPGELVSRREKIGLIVFDEAHRSIAKTYFETLDMLIGSSTSLLGLSATPGRSHYGETNDEESKLVNLFYGNKVLLEIDGYTSPVKALIDKGYLAKLEKEELKIVSSDVDKSQIDEMVNKLHASFEISKEFLNLIGLNAARNLQIVERVESLVLDEDHKRVIVFAPSVESAETISSILNTREVQSHVISNESDVKFRNRVLKKFKSVVDEESMVICNYGVLTTGFDAPRTSAVVIARPTNSIVLLNQMAGRAIRGPKVGGNKTAKLITVVDTEIPKLVETIDQFHAFDDSWKK